MYHGKREGGEAAEGKIKAYGLLALLPKPSDQKSPPPPISHKLLQIGVRAENVHIPKGKKRAKQCVFLATHLSVAVFEERPAVKSPPIFA